MKRLDALQRGEARRLYATVPLLDMIDRQARKYALPPYGLQLRPEEIFQMVVAWIDRVRTEPDNDAAIGLMQDAWSRQWLDLRDMEELSRRTCLDGELEELTCMIICWVYECFVVLSTDALHGNLWYQMMAGNLQLQMMRHMDVWTEVGREVIGECHKAGNWDMLQDWLLGYVERSEAPITTVQGELILQEGGMFLPQPSGEYDRKLYSGKAQKIWKALVDKKWCSKQDSMLKWERSNKALGYCVKIVAHELGVLELTNGKKNIVWQSFQWIFQGLEGSVLSQAKNSASKLDLQQDYHKWHNDAQDLRFLVKCAV